MPSTIKRKACYLIPILVFIGAWQAVSGSGIVNTSLFPPPTAVFLALKNLIITGELFLHIKSSLWRALLGLALGSIAGVAAGLLTGRSKSVDAALTPLFHVFRSFPPVAIIPLVIVWLGIGESAKLFSISFAVFFPVWVNTHIGASSIPKEYLQAASTLTKSRLKMWLKVMLPASCPFIVAGIRTGTSIAFIMVFVSELAGASSGLGYLISVSHLAYRIDNMIAGLITLGALGAATDWAIAHSVRRFFPWIGKMGQI